MEGSVGQSGREEGRAPAPKDEKNLDFLATLASSALDTHNVQADKKWREAAAAKEGKKRKAGDMEASATEGATPTHQIAAPIQ